METQKKSETGSAGSSAVCQRVRDLADRLGVSHIELSRRSGLSYRIIYSIVKGKTNPRPTTLAAIARALGVDVAEITGVPSAETSVVAESGVPYGVPVAPKLKLLAGWVGRFMKCLEENEVIVNGAVNVYGLAFDQAMMPVLLQFAKQERGG